MTLLIVPGAVDQDLARLGCRSTWLQRLPRAARCYRHFLPLMPRGGTVVIHRHVMKGSGFTVWGIRWTS